MDKRTFAGIILIGLVIVVWSTFFAPKPEPEKIAVNGDTNVVETNVPVVGDLDTQDETTPTERAEDDQPEQKGPWSAYTGGTNQQVTISTPLYEATLNSEGALLYRYTIKGYDSWYGDPVQLIEDSTGFGGELAVTLFRGSETIETDDFSFAFDKSGRIELGENDSILLRATLTPVAPTATEENTDGEETPPAESGAQQVLVKEFLFRGDSYAIGLEVDAPKTDRFSIDWRGGLKYQEYSSVEESGKARAYAMLGNDELEDFDTDAETPGQTETFKGAIEWVGTKTKYFAAALIPESAPLAEATVSGFSYPVENDGLIKDYQFSLAVPSGNGPQDFTVLLAPLEFDIAREYNLTGMVDYGFMEFLIRPISEYVLLPLFRLIHGFIANWGLVIIVFSLLIRGALWPLSIPQIKSSEKMRLIQPLMTDMREKYKDDQKKAQMETMKLYREYGVNPAGGCLPLILQLPILYALWNTLANAIDLRQADFMLWIHDLSVPDILFNLPVTLPLIGDQLSGLALIMGATLFIQQKLMITDPKQKMIVYIMPIFLTVAFNYFPAGLNLYYLVYNLMSIGQHYYMRNISKSSLTLEDLKAQAKDKKKGWLSTKLEEAQQMAEMQGKTPGARK